MGLEASSRTIVSNSVKYHVYNATSGRYTSRAHDTQLNRGHASAAKVRRMRGGRSRPLGHASSRGSAERVAAKALDVLEGVASAVHHDVGGDALRVERHERAGRRTERVVRCVSTTARGVASEPAEVASSVGRHAAKDFVAKQLDIGLAVEDSVSIVTKLGFDVAGAGLMVVNVSC